MSGLLSDLATTMTAQINQSCPTEMKPDQQ